jgi:hypothetical protein
MENYKKINSGNSQSHDTITKINCCVKLLHNTKAIANAFNKFYTQIITNLNTKHSDTCKSLSLLRNIKFDNIVQMETIPVSEAEFKTILMSLKPKNTTGYNGIPSKILK